MNTKLSNLLLSVSLPLIAIFLGGCKKGTPEVSTLKSLSGFSLDSTVLTTSNKTTPQFSIKGYCTSKYSDIQVSVDAGKTWVSASTFSTTKTNSCSSLGSFSYDLSFASGAFDSSKWSSADVYSAFMVRGTSSFGNSDSVSTTISLAATPSIGSFTVSGVTGGSDLTPDTYLFSTTMPTISWSAATGATSYEVTIKDAANATAVCALQSTSNLSLAPATCNLVDGVSYKVSVVAKDSSGNSLSATNSPYDLNVDITAPVTFAITGVTGNLDYTVDGYLATTTTPTVNWNASTGASSYEVTIRNWGNSGDACSAQTTTATNLTMNCSLTDGTSYVVAVVAKDLAGNSVFASNNLYTFTVDNTPPSVFTITGITGGSDVTADAMLTSGSNPTVSWSAASGATGYDVKIMQPDSTTVQCALVTTASTSYNFSSCTLTNGSTYFAKVYAKDSLGNSILASNGPFSFSVGAVAVLSLSDGLSFSYGSVNSGSTASKTFTLTNSGSATATSISPSAFAMSEFTFSGGTFPGTGGTCTSTLGAGNSCTIVVIFTPTSGSNFTSTLNIGYNNGLASTNTTRDLSGTGVAGPIAVSVDPVYPTNGANWNDYIRYTNSAGGTKPYNQQDITCTGSETGYYGELGGCIHAGEKKKVVVTGQSSCTNLTISDSLGAFDWICDSSSGTATFYSKGLASGMGLKNLINGSTNAWKTISVTVQLSGGTVAQSTAAAWWSNHISQLPDASSGVQTLGTPGEIYYTNADINSQGYIINAPKISVVTLGAYKITNNRPSVSNWCDTTTGGTSLPIADIMLCGGASQPAFVWIEASLWGASTVSASGAISATGWAFARIHNTIVQQVDPTSTVAGAGFLSLCSSHGNLVTEFKGSNGAVGFHFRSCASASNYNTFKNITLINMGSSFFGGAVVLTGTSSFNRFYDMRIANVFNSTGLANGIYITSGTRNIFQRVSINNVRGTASQSNGVFLNGSAVTSNIFSQLLVYNTQNAAVQISQADSNIFSQFTGTNNTWNGIYLLGMNTDSNHFNSLAIANADKPIQFETSSSSGTSNTFYNVAVASVKSNTAIDTQGFSATTFSGYLINSNPSTEEYCLVGSSNLASNCAGSGVTKVTKANWINAFNGAIAVDDATNPIDVNGTGGWSTYLSIYATALVFDRWTAFDSWFRGWGFSGPWGTSSVGVCTGGSCRIWDWRASSSGPLYNISAQGNFANGTLNTDGNTCVANTVAAADTNTAGSPSITYFRNAMEIDGDGKGNDNGLCEAGEACIWAPNVGAYQGEGTVSSGFCSPDGATLIYKYMTN